MGLKIFTIDFAEYTKHQYLRFDEKFWYTTKNLAVYDYILLKDIFNLVNGNSYTEYYTEEKTEIPYIRIGDLTFKFEIDNKNLIYLDESIKLSDEKILKDDDLILATIGATVGKVNLARNFKGGTFSNNTILLRLKDKVKHNPYFYGKLFQTHLLQKYIWGVVSQKAQPNLQTYDLQNIKVPLIPKSKQDQIVVQIEPIEKKINELRTQITPPQEIINKVFAREFGFDLEKVNNIEKIKYFSITNDITYRNGNLRSSVRWNKIEPIQNILYENNPYIEKLGKYIISTKNGWSPNCKESDSDYSVFGVNSISIDGHIKFEDLKFSNESKNNITEYYAQENDLFVSRGNTVDLVALASVLKNLPEEQNFIYPDLFIKIELNSDYLDKEYLAYLFNSIIGRYYFKYAAKGKNQTMVKISSDELYNFYLPVPPLKLQQKIIDEIKVELDKQEGIKKKIEAERNKIDVIIEKAIK